MSTKLAHQMKAQEAQKTSRSADSLLQRKCDCGRHTIAGGECTECGNKRLTLQRETRNSELGTTNSFGVPPIVHDVLRSPGQPLDAATRGFMEPRLNQDLSSVRVHSGARAAESARAVNALAYTVGQDIVFSTGQYAPATTAGKSLLAHELTHTIQQSAAASRANSLSETEAAEHEAERNSARAAAGSMTLVEGHAASGAIQKADDNALDAKAKKIIDAGKDTSKNIDQRAIDAVNSIIQAYYDPALVDQVVFDEKNPGLSTTYIGTGKDIKGQISVGRYFIDALETFFARKVLQVGHELQHILQQRSGMGGQAKKNEREFLAHHWEATEPEKVGTGRMTHSSRVAHIDEALKNYFCMPNADQKSYADKKEQLLKLRETEEGASGRDHTEPPKECDQKK